ncbi:MAG: tetratricopeptide repeat protein [Vampirovibrionales bacterium]|nr:tetratricopeptide repeat protein [Vampirovibrionales bacterium]
MYLKHFTLFALLALFGSLVADFGIIALAPVARVYAAPAAQPQQPNASLTPVPAAIQTLEQGLLGQAYPNLPQGTRLLQLEQRLGMPSTGSEALRIQRLMQRHQQSQSASPVPAAVNAYNTGIQAAEAGNVLAAETAYRDALKADPAFIAAYNNLADVLVSLGKLDEATQLYQRAVQLSPNNAALYRNLAVTLERNGQIEQAMRAYESYLSVSHTPEPKIAQLVQNYRLNIAQARTQKDYLDQATAASGGRLVLWAQAQLPVPVFIAFETQEAMLFLPEVREAMLAWEQATHQRVQFQEVNAPLPPKAPGIWITVQPGTLAHPFLDVAHARFEAPDSWQLQGEAGPLSFRQHLHKAPSSPNRVQITLNIGNPNEALKLRKRQVKRLAMHELGHAIGIWGHSASPADMMYTHPNVDALSARDVATAQALYAQNVPEKPAPQRSAPLNPFGF